MNWESKNSWGICPRSLYIKFYEHSGHPRKNQGMLGKSKEDGSARGAICAKGALRYCACYMRVRVSALISSLSLCHKGNGNINFVPGDNKLLVFVFLDEFQLGELFDVLVNVSICTV